MVTVFPSELSVTITGVSAKGSAVNSPVILLSVVKTSFISDPPAGMLLTVILKKLARCLNVPLVPVMRPNIGGLKLFASSSIDSYV